MLRNKYQARERENNLTDDSNICDDATADHTVSLTRNHYLQKEELAEMAMLSAAVLVIILTYSAGPIR